jgi:hypothetical protein
MRTMTGLTLILGFPATRMLMIVTGQTAITSNGIAGRTDTRVVTGQIRFFHPHGLGGMGTMTGVTFHHHMGHERGGILINQFRIRFMTAATQTGLAVLDGITGIKILYRGMTSGSTITLSSPGKRHDTTQQTNC